MFGWFSPEEWSRVVSRWLLKVDKIHFSEAKVTWTIRVWQTHQKFKFMLQFQQRRGFKLPTSTWKLSECTRAALQRTSLRSPHQRLTCRHPCTRQTPMTFAFSSALRGSTDLTGSPRKQQPPPQLPAEVQGRQSPRLHHNSCFSLR